MGETAIASVLRAVKKLTSEAFVSGWKACNGASCAGHNVENVE